jgi:flagellar protein FlbT
LALRLQLKPGERMLVGGAVVRNGATRAELFVENDAPVLREQDVLRPEAVRTPCERIYLALQLMYVDDRAPGLYSDAYRELTEEVLAAAPSCAPLVRAIDEKLEAGQLFRALRSARRLIDYERELLSHAS